MKKRTKIATRILEREYAKTLIKIAVGAAPGFSSPAIWNGKPSLATQPKPAPPEIDLGNAASRARNGAVGLVNVAAGGPSAVAGAMGRGLSSPGTPWHHHWDSVARRGYENATAGAHDAAEAAFGTNLRPNESTWVDQLRQTRDQQMAQDPHTSSYARGATNVANAGADMATDMAAFNVAGGPLVKAAPTAANTVFAGLTAANALAPYAGPNGALLTNTVNEGARVLGAKEPFAPYQTDAELAAQNQQQFDDYLTGLDEQRQQEETQEQNNQHVGAALQLRGLYNQDRRSDNTDYAMSDAMARDPAIINRLAHGQDPLAPSPQNAGTSYAAEEQALNATEPLPVLPQNPSASEKNTAEPAAVAAGPSAEAATAANAGGTPDATAAAATAAATAPSQAEPPPVVAETPVENAAPAPAAPTPATPAPAQPAAPTVAAATAQNQQKREQAHSQLQTAVTAANGDATKMKEAIGLYADSVKSTLSGTEQTGATHVAAGDYKSPEAQAFIKQYMEPAQQKFIADVMAQNPGDTSLYGQAVGMLSNLGLPGQIALGLGLSAGVLGLLGGGGISMLLSALGIGAAGLFGAAGGVFGEDAQRSVGQGIDSVGKMLGMNIPESPDVSKLIGPNAAANIRGEVTKGLTPEEQLAIAFKPDAREKQRQNVRAQLQQFDSLQRLADMPEAVAVPWLMHAGRDGAGAAGKPLNEAVARQVYRNAVLTAQMAANKDDPMAQQLEMARKFDADPDAFINQRIAEQAAAAQQQAAAAGRQAVEAARSFAPEATKRVGEAAEQAKNMALDWWKSTGKKK